MSAVISLRISRELKKELEELNIDYSDEVRQYLEELVRREKIRRGLRSASQIRSKIRVTTPSAELIREDRDAGD